MLPKDDATLIRSKALLTQLQAHHGFSLGGNGLPQKEKGQGLNAADVWALFAATVEGAEIANQLHNTLLTNDIWIWQAGCIEDVIRSQKKGEAAIVEQEEAIVLKDASALETVMPEMKRCFDWLQRFRQAANA